MTVIPHQLTIVTSEAQESADLSGSLGNGELLHSFELGPLCLDAIRANDVAEVMETAHAELAFLPLGEELDGCKGVEDCLDVLEVIVCVSGVHNDVIEENCGEFVEEGPKDFSDDVHGVAWGIRQAEGDDFPVEVAQRGDHSGLVLVLISNPKLPKHPSQINLREDSAAL